MVFVKDGISEEKTDFALDKIIKAAGDLEERDTEKFGMAVRKA
jgi:hypothetical protein